MPIPIRRALVAGVSLLLVLEARSETLSAVPKVDGKEAVAVVNGEPVTLDEFLREFEALHVEAREMGQVVPRKDPSDLLNRLVNATLILQEARTIGLEELPEYQATVRAAAKDALRTAVLDRATRDVPPPAPDRVEKLFKDKVMEFRVAAVLFRSPEDATSGVEALAGTPDFLAAGRSLLDAGRAEAVEEPRSLKRSEMVPEVVAALEPLEPGGLTAPVRAGDSIAVVQLLERRYPDDPEARARATEELRREDGSAALRAFVDALVKRRVKEDRKILESLDFDSDADAFEKYLEDDRVVAKIRGAEPIRVRDVAKTLKQRFFHGVDRAAEKGRLGKAIPNVLEKLEIEAAIQQEGKDLGLDRTADYEREMKQVREDSLFGLFIQKVVEPSIRIDDDEVKRAYEASLGEFTTPEMIRIDSLAFADADAGRKAVERLQAGADFAWMRENAEGRVSADEVPATLRFAGSLVMTTSLEAAVRETLAGASPGSYRLFVEPSGRAHVLLVRDRVPARPAPLDEVRMEVARRVFGKKRQETVDEWAAKLREASEIEIFVSSEQLRELASRGRPENPH